MLAGLLEMPPRPPAGIRASIRGSYGGWKTKLSLNANLTLLCGGYQVLRKWHLPVRSTLLQSSAAGFLNWKCVWSAAPELKLMPAAIPQQ